MWDYTDSEYDDFINKQEWEKHDKNKNGEKSNNIWEGDYYRLDYFGDTYAIRTESFIFNIPNGLPVNQYKGLGKNPRLFKLHGSKNWLFSNKRDSIIVDDIEFLRKRFFGTPDFYGRNEKDINEYFQILKKAANP